MTTFHQMLTLNGTYGKLGVPASGERLTTEAYIHGMICPICSRIPQARVNSGNLVARYYQNAWRFSFND